MSKEVLQEALELLAVATFITPKLQAKRTEVINAGLQALERPAQRTWVGLTDEEIEDCYGGEINDFAKAIEAKLKELNA